ncbi:MAG: c-type cytochrome [Alphaproteobacteria bacterium]|nr:c-type cytochrome [Alphaproteobacteria bacterium]
MLTRSCGMMFGAGLALTLAAGAAQAADDIEAKAQTCAACHGENGMPTDPKIIPIIWGQQESYIVKQLHDYRSGDRENPIMTPIAKDLAQEDLRKIARYFAAKAWPAQPGAAGAALPNGAAQCQPCHQPKFEGGMPAPRLAGLSYDFLIAQMNAFADGERTNNLDMPKFMQMLAPAEREAIARYLAAL